MAVAKSTCCNCHHIHPRNTMVKVTSKVNSGHSTGGGMSWGHKNKQGKRNARYYAGGRTYYRKVSNWWCASCYSALEERQSKRAKFWLVVVALLVFVPWGYMSYFHVPMHERPIAEQIADQVERVARAQGSLDNNLLRCAQLRAQMTSDGFCMGKHQVGAKRITLRDAVKRLEMLKAQQASQ